MGGSILQTLLTGLTGDSLSGLGRQLGVEEGAAAQAAATAMPVLLGALAKNTASQDGAASLAAALDRDHDGAILDDLAGHLSGGSLDDGTAILGHVLGSNQATVEQSLSEKTGLEPAAIGRLLATLAPVVLGMLGKERRTRGLDPSGLAELLGDEAKSAGPDLGDMLGGLLSSAGGKLFD